VWSDFTVGCVRKEGKARVARIAGAKKREKKVSVRDYGTKWQTVNLSLY
jgi:hypothetical protein